MSYRDQDVRGARAYSFTDSGYGHRLSKDFVLGEYASRCGSPLVVVHPALAELVQKIRDRVGGPVTISSGYRTLAHNIKVKGSPDSRHMFGLAADLHTRFATPREVADIARALGAGGVKAYNTFCHVDVWQERTW